MDKNQTQNRKPGWLREQMPKVAAMIDERRTKWGAEHVNKMVADGMAGKPNCFYAFEGGLIVGTNFTPDAAPVSDATLARAAMFGGASFMAMAQPKDAERPINDHKAICSAMAPAGWTYTGYDDGCYCFQTGSHSHGFKEIQAFEEDLTPENLALMAKLSVTRVKPSRGSR